MTKTITVRKLIELLNKYPEETEVWTEGCDCIGNVVGIEKMGDYPCSIMLQRDN